jgi:hypothetical protein
MKVAFPGMAAAAVAVAVAALAGCTNGHASHRVNPRGSASPTSVYAQVPHTLPAFPATVSGHVLVKESGGAGLSQFVTGPVKAGRLTVEAACVGPDASKMNLAVLTAAGKSLFLSNASPCIGQIRNIGLTVDASQAGYRFKLDIPTDAKFALLVTQ